MSACVKGKARTGYLIGCFFLGQDLVRSLTPVRADCCEHQSATGGVGTCTHDSTWRSTALSNAIRAPPDARTRLRAGEGVLQDQDWRLVASRSR